MDLKRLFEVLDTVSVAGMKQVVLEPEDNGVKVRGVDEDNSVIVLDTISGDFVPHSLGVHRVGTVLDRLKLFNLDNAKVEVSKSDSKEDVIDSILIKEGRKKAFCRFSDPDFIRSPKKMAVDETIATITLTSDKVTEITSAVGALNPEFLTLRGDGDDIWLDLYEKDTNDQFSDVVGSNESGAWEYNWNVKSFVRLAKQAIKTDDEITLVVGSRSKLTLSVNGIEFVLLPQVAK